MRFVVRFEPFEDLSGLIDRRFLHDDFLQPACQSAVLFDLFVLFECRRTDYSQLSCRKDRLNQRSEIHRATGRGTGTDSGMDLVDK